MTSTVTPSDLYYLERVLSMDYSTLGHFLALYLPYLLFPRNGLSAFQVILSGRAPWARLLVVGLLVPGQNSVQVL